MNILFTNFHTDSTIGGHSVYIFSLLNALAARHNLSVAVPKSSGLARLANSLPGVRFIPQEYPSHLFKRLRAARQLRRAIREQRFDVIHVNGSADHRTVMQACLGLGRRRPRIVFTKLAGGAGRRGQKGAAGPARGRLQAAGGKQRRDR